MAGISKKERIKRRSLAFKYYSQKLSEALQDDDDSEINSYLIIVTEIMRDLGEFYPFSTLAKNTYTPLTQKAYDTMAHYFLTNQPCGLTTCTRP